MCLDQEMVLKIRFELYNLVSHVQYVYVCGLFTHLLNVVINHCSYFI